MTSKALTLCGDVQCNACGFKYFGPGGQVVYPCPECGWKYNWVNDWIIHTAIEGMKLLYLGSPYSHPDEAVVEERVRMTCVFAAYLISRGKNIFAPIPHTHYIAKLGGLSTEFDYWEQYDMLMLSRSDEFGILKLEGWDRSVGIQCELNIATTLGKPIIYFDPSEMNR